MRWRWLVCCAVALVSWAGNARAVDTFYEISGITSSTQGSDLFAVGNLIHGPGVGFDANAPYNQITNDFAAARWVTAAPFGFPSDYIALGGTPVMTIDLGENRLLGEISTWGYTTSNANGVSLFSLRFATDAEGPGAFGTSITYNPAFEMDINDLPRQSFPFDRLVSARWVEFTALDNYYFGNGQGEPGHPPGGDRVGMGEIAFQVPIPEPSSFVLAGLGLASLVVLRRRAR